MCIVKGQTQLYLLVKAFPPPREDLHTYRSLVAACLASYSPSSSTNDRPLASPLDEDDQGRSALFVLCERMAHVRHDAYPEAPSILKMVLDCTGGNIGGADRSGRTVFDLDQHGEDGEGPYTCLRAARELLVQAGTRTSTKSSKSGVSGTSSYRSTSGSVMHSRASHKESSSRIQNSTNRHGTSTLQHYHTTSEE